jgi:hypothetical protein
MTGNGTPSDKPGGLSYLPLIATSRLLGEAVPAGNLLALWNTAVRVDPVIVRPSGSTCVDRYR